MPLPLLLIPAAPLAFGAVKSIFTKNLDIAVLGTKAAGKTTLINILQTGEVNTPSQATSFEEKVEKIDAPWKRENRLEKTKILVNEKKDGLIRKALFKVAEKVLPIDMRKGHDVPGDESFRQTYEEYMEGKDILFLLFDVHHYLNPEWDSKDGGKREAQALFDFIYDRRSKLASNGKVILLATHKDLVKGLVRKKDDTSILEEFRLTLKGKPYAELSQNCVPVDLTSDNCLKQIEKLCEE